MGVDNDDLSAHLASRHAVEEPSRPGPSTSVNYGRPSSSDRGRPVSRCCATSSKSYQSW
jgi:hypothetical protein